MRPIDGGRLICAFVASAVFELFITFSRTTRAACALVDGANDGRKALTVMSYPEEVDEKNEVPSGRSIVNFKSRI